MPKHPYGHKLPAIIHTHTHTQLHSKPGSHVQLQIVPTERHQNKCEDPHVWPRVCVCVMTAREGNSIQLIGKADYITRKLQYLSNGVRIPLPFRGVLLASITMATRELCTPGETGAPEDTCAAQLLKK